MLADWLDRERLEGVMDVSDEIAAHQKRLADLLAQYQQTKDPRLLDEIERELKALDRSYAELEKHRRGMPEDVLDQYVNRDAGPDGAGHAVPRRGPPDDPRGQVREAQAKLGVVPRAAGPERREPRGLAGRRCASDKFSDEQRKLDEVMNELADLAKDQDDIAAEANRIFEDYALKADEVAKEHRREASRKVGTLVEKLRKRLQGHGRDGLTPFAKEELDIVERRLADVESMVSDGDLGRGDEHGAPGQAEPRHDRGRARGGARGRSEIEVGGRHAGRARRGGQGAPDRQGQLIDELQALLPRPEQIMSADDLKALERLRRRQVGTRDRARRLVGADPAAGRRAARRRGRRAGQEAGRRDQAHGCRPTSARARRIRRGRARARARGGRCARQGARPGAQRGPPGAGGRGRRRADPDPGRRRYRAPERFREDLLEAMKKKGAQGPD